VKRVAVIGAGLAGAAAAVVVAAILVLAAPVLAADDPAPATLSLADLGIKGTVVYKNFTHFDTTDTDRQHIRNEGLLQLEWARRLAPWSDARIVVDIRGDDAGFTDGVTFDIQDRSRRRSIVDLKEAVLGARGGPVAASAGKQIFAWGTGDAFNPTDNINAYDYLDVIDNEKIGVWSAALRLTAGPASVDFVVIPVFTPSRLPLPRSRWTPRLPAGFVGLVDDPEVPPVETDNMQYAARVKATLRGVDVSLSYYDGFEHTPVVRLSTAAVAPGVVLPRFTPVFTRVKVAGLDFSTTYGALEMHGETAFRFVEANGRDDRFQGIAGINYTWDSLPVAWLEQVVIVAEYAREETLSSRRHSNIQELGTVPGLGDLLAKNAFRDAVVGRILLKVSEKTQLEVSGTVDLVRSANYFVQPKLMHKLTDALHVEAGLDLFAGEPRTFWGRWRENDRFFFFMKYFF
jgi:hypothetical protein